MNGQAKHSLWSKPVLGNREAFGELVRRHRGKALGWATTLSRDITLAEDIVQDALIRAFLHVGELADVSAIPAMVPPDCAEPSESSLATRRAIWQGASIYEHGSPVRFKSFIYMG